MQTVKENIIKSKAPIYNPIMLIGLDKIKRFRIFYVIFDKAFNSKYKKYVTYTTVEKIEIEKVKEKRLIILENIHEISKNKDMQDKLCKLLDLCFKLKIQVVLCSNDNINDLEFDKLVKSKMLYGLTTYLEER